MQGHRPIAGEGQPTSPPNVGSAGKQPEPHTISVRIDDEPDWRRLALGKARSTPAFASSAPTFTPAEPDGSDWIPGTLCDTRDPYHPGEYASIGAHADDGIIYGGDDCDT